MVKAAAYNRIEPVPLDVLWIHPLMNGLPEEPRSFNVRSLVFAHTPVTHI